MNDEFGKGLHGELAPVGDAHPSRGACLEREEELIQSQEDTSGVSLNMRTLSHSVHLIERALRSETTSGLLSPRWTYANRAKCVNFMAVRR